MIGRPLIGRPLIGSPLIGAGVTPGCAGAKALSGMLEIGSFEPDMFTEPALVRLLVTPVGVLPWPAESAAA